MTYRPIITTLAFVVRGNEVLLVHRIRLGDDQHGKFNGLGGKLTPAEDVVAGMQREVYEEAGIQPTGFRLRGTVSWPGFGKHGEDVLGFIFVVDEWSGEVAAASDEGPLSWHPVDSLSTLPMWEGDRHFLPLVFDEAVAQFHGVLPYENGRPVSWSATVLPLDSQLGSGPRHLLRSVTH